MNNKKSQSMLESNVCFIQPGYLAVGRDPSLIGVVCGNGVVVCLWDKIRRVGGVAHYIYPKVHRKENPSNYHAEIAIRSLIKSIHDHSGYIRNFEALLFGGGNLNGYAKERAEQTIHVTRKALKKMDITIKSEDLGGSLGRKILFNTYSGEAVVWKTRNIRRMDWAPEMIGRV